MKILLSWRRPSRYMMEEFFPGFESVLYGDPLGKLTGITRAIIIEAPRGDEHRQWMQDEVFSRLAPGVEVEQLI